MFMMAASAGYGSEDDAAVVKAKVSGTGPKTETKDSKK